MMLDIDESDRQLLILSLALCSRLRPGWKYATCEIAKKLDGGSQAMFDTFRECNSDLMPTSNPTPIPPNEHCPSL